jgi:tripartite-type tricarboxylate transporter receptor subunit TctC
LNYGSWSIGNPVHLGSALFESVTGTRMLHVPYKETSQLYMDVATNELAFSLGTSASTSALYRAGKLRFLAVAAPQRLAAFPDVPTVGEAGGPAGFSVIGWTALAAPRGLPAAVTDKIHRDVAKALAEQDIQDRYRAFGYETFPLSREQFTQFIREESVRFGDVIKKANVSIE